MDILHVHPAHIQAGCRYRGISIQISDRLLVNSLTNPNVPMFDSETLLHPNLAVLLMNREAQVCIFPLSQAGKFLKETNRFYENSKQSRTYKMCMNELSTADFIKKISPIM